MTSIPGTPLHSDLSTPSPRVSNLVPPAATHVEVTLALTNDQLTRIETSLVRPRPRFWTSDALLRTIQLLALVIGGCWVMLKFLLFEQTGIELDLEKARNQIKLDSLEQKRRSADLVSSTTYGFEVDRDIIVSYLQPLDSLTALYEVHYQINVTNKSEVPFEISMWALDYFAGELRKDLRESALFVEPVGYPANRWNPGSASGGAVKWTLVGSTGSIHAASSDPINSVGSPRWSTSNCDVKVE